MRAAEFLAWLDGYSSSFVDGVPTAEQFKEIRRKAELLRQSDFSTHGNPRVGMLSGDIPVKGR